MIRMIRLELDGVRNVVHGVIDFTDLESGGSIMGLYGQNGSGKTCVIDAIDILRRLMRGDRLPEGSAEVVNNDIRKATLTATYRIETGETVRCVEYSVSLAAGDGNRAHVTGETLRMGDDPRRMGRPIIGRTVQSDGVSRQPAFAWRSLMPLDNVRGDVEFFDRAEQFDGMSFLFARYGEISRSGDDETTMLGHLADLATRADGLSARTAEYLRDRLLPLSETVGILSDHARDDVYVYTTRRGSMASFQFAPIFDMKTDSTILLDLLGPNYLTDDKLDRVHETIGIYNMILPTLIPHLKLSLPESPATADDSGNRRTQVEIMSSRGGSAFPFRNESEGIIRITLLLSFYIRVYNDPDVLVAVDEIDSGVYEILLGEMVRQMASGIRGQLVFTAHNLRPFEVLPPSCLWTTVRDKDDRFSRVPYYRQTNNGRNVYSDSANLGWDGPDIYDAPPARMYANALRQAGHPSIGGR